MSDLARWDRFTVAWRHRWRRGLVLTLGALLCCARAEAQRQDGPVTIEKIRSHWKAREDRIKSIAITWQEKYTQPKGSVSSSPSMHVLRSRMKIPAGLVIPPRDLTHEFRMTIDIMGSKVRHSRKGTKWSISEAALVPDSYESTFDGTTSKELYPAGQGKDHRWPSGGVRRQPYFVDARNSDLQPVLMAVRPVNPAFLPLELDAFRLTGRRPQVNNNKCVELERVGANPKDWVRIVLDPARDFVVVRQTNSSGGQTRYKADIRYQKHEGGVWLPGKWDTILLENGRVTQAVQATTTECSLNGKLAPSTFFLAFPNGTAVNDERARERYILRPDGSKRLLQASDSGLTYEQIINSEPGQVTGHRLVFSLQSWVGRGLAGIGFLVVCAAVWWLRSRRMRDHTPPG